ncbi:Hypothetical protein NocV09_06700170 [Nannochloropsis oceanica]
MHLPALPSSKHGRGGNIRNSKHGRSGNKLKADIAIEQIPGKSFLVLLSCRPRTLVNCSSLRDLQSHIYELRLSYAAKGASRLPFFDVCPGFMCEACHASPHELTREYINSSKNSFYINHAKSCPS